jgi:hypothetical protein
MFFLLRGCFKSCHEASKTQIPAIREQRNINKLGENLVPWRLCGKGSGLLKQFLRNHSGRGKLITQTPKYSYIMSKPATISPFNGLRIRK